MGTWRSSSRSDASGWCSTTSFRAPPAWAYHAVYPHLAGSWALTAAKWSHSRRLILPQSVLLGMTFPLMSAGVLRLGPSRPGRKLSLLYFSNSLGASVGVLVAGFYLVELAGLPGTLLAAAMLNLAGCRRDHLRNGRRAECAVEAAGASEGRASPARPPAVPRKLPTALERLLLFTSYGTAVASFIYEIDWIRMLALVLGSATHSFELMLSAFILGLAFGAWWIRSRADRLNNPLRTLGMVQWTMGMLAMATLPLYVSSFDWIASLLTTFARNDAGYIGFTIARYGLCLAIMLPATFCAGMTLPLITRILLEKGSGERAIGAVYAWNTLGSILGVVRGGLGPATDGRGQGDAHRRRRAGYGNRGVASVSGRTGPQPRGQEWSSGSTLRWASWSLRWPWAPASSRTGWPAESSAPAW